MNFKKIRKKKKPKDREDKKKNLNAMTKKNSKRKEGNIQRKEKKR